MGRKSKNQKIREAALDDLEKVKSKLHPRTYHAYKTKLRGKRIDVVKRITTELNTLGKVKGDKPLSLPNVKLEVHELKRMHATKLQAFVRNKSMGKIKSFNQTGNPVTIFNLTPNKFILILNNLDLTKRTVMEVNGKFYTLSPAKVKELLNDIDAFWVHTVEHQGTNYNADIIHDIKDIREITLSRPTWKGRNKNEGAFFKHYNNTRIDLGKCGVHNEKQFPL